MTENDVWALSLKRQRKSPLPVFMDPFTILSTLQALVGCVQWTFDAIQKVKQAEADEKDALKKLKATMSDVKTDISVFDTVVSVLQSPENKHFYSVFMEKYASVVRFYIRGHYNDFFADRVLKTL